MTPLISIIVPCYNQAHYLDECLQSVFDQTYTNWECIIVNDGSPDNIEEVVLPWREMDERFKYLKKENGGLSSARNAGIKVANGDWLQFLDCDDILEKDKLTESTAYFEKNIDVIISGYRYFETKDGTGALRIYGRDNFLPEVCISKNDYIDLKNLFRYKNPYVISAPLYSRKIFALIGGFDERLRSLEDWEFNLRCVLHDFVFHHIGYKTFTKTLIRLHNSSMMRDEKRMNESLRLFHEINNSNKKFVELFGENKMSPSFRVFNYSVKEFFLLFLPPIITIVVKSIISKSQLNLK